MGHYLARFWPSLVASATFTRIFQLLMSKPYGVLVDLAILSIAVGTVVTERSDFSHSKAFHIALCVMTMDSLSKLIIIGPLRLLSFVKHRYDVIATAGALLSFVVVTSENSTGVVFERYSHTYSFTVV